ncbi:T9SS type A sorting domain-containing protein [Subsaximicrobium wynnwilliamsii]|uniref:T9SS type A sorting domain-containing protein n=1 Tax=Subsaximicrobium wynnwilliamsii TaxID=291179 RepID=A0A5C6ZFZ1_9FLAO|nr:T9SS type A sorting domain-containing protein [Subsaximicrobium wynnwilliamsii]TXD83082.1 T9SS type A sorting domain-containing protein [Subsaximicrobium wynnwilliamsii]TXD88826.1 T9SS type A sorting domain-containing protein [Subsaximicrobium wynnwilliamsii]TXE02899.1 T9SS type A sorting domain-containing protein [Subsaximicrobium wynnwilliamsii]
MKRILLIIFLSIGLVFSGWSQITAAEYFIDADPGIGNATNLTISSGNQIDTNFSIPTVGLSNGLHVLHIRVKGTSNVWSLYYRDYFYILTTEAPAAGSNLSAAEYFIDTDPGVGNAIALSIASGQTIDNTFSIPTSGLANGLHVLHMRTQDLDGTWSLYYRDYFYIHSVNNFVSTPITGAEYFFDTDPGVGNGISIAITEGFTIDETLAIPVPEDMTDGNHYLYIRVKNMDDNWSTYIFALFSVDSNLSVEEINDQDFKVFPNPAHTFLNVKINSGLDYSIQLFDVNGKELIQTKTNGTLHKLDFSSYAEGLYLLHVTESKTGKRSVVKIVKS